MKTNYAGIDYSLGKSNRDENGIHYGVIPANEVPAWYEESETDYGNATCPKCGGPAPDGDIRGYKFAIEKDGRVISSGGIPLMGDANDATSKFEYYKNLADQAGGKLYLGRKDGYLDSAPNEPLEPLIVGKTWRQIQNMQNKVDHPQGITSYMPKDAVLVYDSAAPAEQQPADEPQPGGKTLPKRRL